MALQSSASDGGADRNTVFIDTNLDTHMAMLVSDADTVSDLKKRIMVEHPLCFPKIGHVQIHAIKVKRKGYFYHLSDSMLVRSAFIGFNKSWFLSVDASALMEHEKNQISNSPGSSNQVVCHAIANNASNGDIDIPLSCPSRKASDINCIDLPQSENRQDEKEEVPFVSPCVSEHSGKGVADNMETRVKPSGNDDTVIPSPGSIPEKKDQCSIRQELPSSRVECKVDGFSKGNKDESNGCEEETLKAVPSAKKKRKSIRKKEVTEQVDVFKEKNASFLGPGKSTVQQGIMVPEDPSEDASREFSNGTIMGENNITHELCWNSKKTSSGVQMSNETFKETEAPKEEAECNNNNTKKNIDAECNKSMKEASEPGSTVNKKQRKRKRSLNHGLKEEMLKVESASQKDEVHKSNEEQENIKEPKEQAELNNGKSGDGIESQHNKVSQEPSDTGSPAKKKQKGKVRSGYESALKEKRSMIGDSNKETLKPENASQHSLEDLPKIENRDADHGLKEEMLKVESASEKDEVHKANEEQEKIEEPKEQAGLNNDNSDGIESQHNKVSQEPSDTGSPAKKKQKGKVRSGYESALKEKRSMIGNSNKETLKPENASQQSLEDLRKIENSGADQSIEHFDDAYQLRTSVLGSKRKRKKNSSNHQTAAGTSSRNDDEVEHSRIYGEGFQEEILKDGQISKDVNVSKNGGDNLDENVALEHCHLSEAGQTVRAEEGREISLLDDPKHLLSENCTLSHQNNTDENIRELTVTSEVLEANKTTELGKSEKKRRKKRNAKDSDEGPLKTEDFSRVDASKSDTFSKESHRAINCDPTSGNIKTEENLLKQTERENIPPEEMKGAYLSATDGEVNDINAGSLENNGKAEAHAENVSEKKSKKSKKKQTPTPRSASEMLTNDQVPDHKEPSPTSDSRLLVEPSSKKTKKNKSASTKSTNKSSGPILEPERDFMGFEPPCSPSKARKGNYKSPFGANDTAIDSIPSFIDEGNNHLEAPSKSDKINVEQHSASRQQQRKDIVSDDILVDENGADIELMAGKNAKELEVMKGNTRTGSLRSSQQLLSKEDDRLGINPDKKVPKVNITGQDAQLSSQSNSVTSTIEENKRPQVNISSGKSTDLEKSEAFPVSNSKLKGPKKVVQNKVGKASGNNMEGAVSKKEQKKSLLAGTIFKDDSSGTSEDEDKRVNDSSSSTKTPSDNSLSSDYSDGDSHAGSHGRKRLETGGRSSIKSRLSDTRGMPIDSILRSSSRYKKAKMTASQLEETESQAVDFVPDSLADT